MSRAKKTAKKATPAASHCSGAMYGVESPDEPSDPDPKLGLPKGTHVIQCDTGPTYTLMITGGTPAQFRKALVRAAASVQSPLRELLAKRPEYDVALERLLYEDQTDDCHDDVNELRVRLRELATAGGTKL